MTRPTTAIVLAAGRGSRLGGLTEDLPKCLVPLSGTPLLEWQIRSLRAAGIGRVVAVCGHQGDRIAATGVETRMNPDWAITNMVASLLCARDLITGPVIVSYADIVYGPEAVHALAATEGHLALTYDADWLDLWTARFDDPLSDAESFRLADGGKLREIGRGAASTEEIEGQYMGLLQIDETALGWIDTYLADLGAENARRIDMTSLLNGLLGAGHAIDAVPVRGGWCEVDSPRDLAVAHEWLAAGRLGLLSQSEQ